MPIKCDGCSAPCCRVIGRIEPTLDRGDLCCKHLDEETVKCKIYNDRPLICNTDKLYETVFNFMPREEYDKLNSIACKELKEMATNYLANSIKGEVS